MQGEQAEGRARRNNVECWRSGNGTRSDYLSVGEDIRIGDSKHFKLSDSPEAPTDHEMMVLLMRMHSLQSHCARRRGGTGAPKAAM